MVNHRFFQQRKSGGFNQLIDKEHCAVRNALLKKFLFAYSAEPGQPVCHKNMSPPT